MSGQPPIAGGVPLDGLGQAVVRSKRVIFAGAIDVLQGGLSEPGQDLHVRVGDLTTGEFWLVPISDQLARKLAHQLIDAVEQHHTP